MNPGICEERLLRKPGRFLVQKFEVPDEDWLRARLLGEDPEFVFLREKLDEIEFYNAYVNAGSAVVLDLIIGAGGTVFNNANAHLGVGDSSTAVAVGQTDLQAATNKLRKAMNATFPLRASQVMTWKSDFGSGEANFTWNECGMFNASSGGSMLCRTVQNLGTKTTGVWTLTYTITMP